MSHDRSLQSGFTLIEIIVTLVIGVMVLAGARAVLHHIADSAERATAAAVAADRVANTEHVARMLVEHTRAADSIAIFSGTESSVQFASWCEVAAGWSEPCDVILQIVPYSAAGMHTSHMSSIQLTTSLGDSLQLRDRVPFARLRYLEDAVNGGVWRSMWAEEMMTPLAIGIVLAQDTLIMRIGERR